MKISTTEPLYKLAMASKILPTAAGVGLASLENRYVVPDLDPGLKNVNLGIGGLTGLMLASPDPKWQLAAIGTLPFKQLGLFGISSMDKLRKQQQSLVDANLQVADINRQTAELNRSDAAGKGRAMLMFLLPALAAGGALGYMGWSQYKKNRDKDKIPRYGTVAEKGTRRGGEKIRIDVPARAIPPEFFRSLTNVDDSPRAYTRLMRLDDQPELPKEAKEFVEKMASTESFSVPRFLGDIAWETTGIPGIQRTFKDVGLGADRFLDDKFEDAGRYGLGAAGNALLTLMTLRGATFPALGKLMGQRYLLSQMGRGDLLRQMGSTVPPRPGFLGRQFKTMPSIAEKLHHYAYGPVPAPGGPPIVPPHIRHAYDPTRYAWTGATTRSPLFQRFLTSPPAGRFTPSIPRHLMNVGRYGANRLWNAGYWTKQLAKRSPLMSLFALGTIPAMLGSELDERRNLETAENLNRFKANWAANKGPMGIPVSSIFGGLMEALGGQSPRTSLRDQIRGGNFDLWGMGNR